MAKNVTLTHKDNDFRADMEVYWWFSSPRCSYCGEKVNVDKVHICKQVFAE